MPEDGPSVAAEVGHLFRTKRVSEIRQIESSVRSDAEERGGQLRSLLGTRYKDLLLAADAVAAARDASRNAVQDALAGVARDANSLRADFLAHSSSPQPRLHATPSANASRDAAEADLARRRETSALGARLLHIVDSPEVLYACLEDGRVEEATVRFAASKKARAELHSKVAPAFTRNRWNLVEAFRSQIVSSAMARIETQRLSPEDYAGSFIALAILSQESDALPGAVAAFLAARTKWITATLESPQPASLPESVAGRLASLASIVHDTVTCCGRLFFGKSPLVVEKLAAIDAQAAAEIATLGTDGTIVARVTEWLKSTETAVQEGGTAIVADAKTAGVLASALDAVNAVFKDSEPWQTCCQGPLGVTPSKGVAMLRPIVFHRANLIAVSSIQNCCATAVASIDAAFADISERNNVADALWSASVSDAVRWQSHRFDDDAGATQVHQSDDLTRQLVRTGRAAVIVANLERSLGHALSDVDLLVHHIPEVAESLRKAVSDSLPSVALCLRDKARELTELASSHRASFLATTKQGEAPSPVRVTSPRGGEATPNHAASIERALFAARTAAAIAYADHIPAAFTYRNAAVDANVAAPKAPELQSFYQTAQGASEKAYEAWAAVLCIQFESQLRRDLPSVFSLEMHSPWDAHGRRKQSSTNDSNPSAPKESGDGPGPGNATEYHPCPTTPSSGTLRFVLSSCEAANSAGGLALPPGAIRALADALLASVSIVFEDTLSQYSKHRESLVANDSRGFRAGSGRPENVFLQLLFDIRFLSGLLGGISAPASDGKLVFGQDQLPKELLSIISSISEQIDPINLSSIKTVFDEAVDTYLGRSNVLVGTLARNTGKRRGPQARNTSSWNAFASASILAVAKPVERFSYLPAPMPSTYTARTGLTAGLGAKAAVELLQTETTSDSSRRIRDAEATVVDYASKLSENVGRFGRGFLESFRGVG